MSQKYVFPERSFLALMAQTALFSEKDKSKLHRKCKQCGVFGKREGFQGRGAREEIESGEKYYEKGCYANKCLWVLILFLLCP